MSCDNGIVQPSDSSPTVADKKPIGNFKECVYKGVGAYNEIATKLNYQGDVSRVGIGRICSTKEECVKYLQADCLTVDTPEQCKIEEIRNMSDCLDSNWVRIKSSGIYLSCKNDEDCYEQTETTIAIQLQSYKDFILRMNEAYKQNPEMVAPQSDAELNADFKKMEDSLKLTIPEKQKFIRCNDDFCEVAKYFGIGLELTLKGRSAVSSN